MFNIELLFGPGDGRVFSDENLPGQFTITETVQLKGQEPCQRVHTYNKGDVKTRDNGIFYQYIYQGFIENQSYA